MKKAIITISGVSGSGKDEVRKIIQKYITPSNKRINFADKLKQTASILLGVDVKKFEDQDFKNSYLMDWGMTVREFLQKLGTEAIRNGLHTDAWVLAYRNDVFNSTEDVILTTDLRMENEFNCFSSLLDDYEVVKIGINRLTSLEDWLRLDGIYDDFYNSKKRNKERVGVDQYIHILKDFNIKSFNTKEAKERIDRVLKKRTHFSEIDIHDYEFDHPIENSRDLKELENEVVYVLREYDFFKEYLGRYNNHVTDLEIYNYMSKITKHIPKYYIEKYFGEFFSDRNGEFFNEAKKYYPADPFKTAKAIEKFLV